MPAKAQPIFGPQTHMVSALFQAAAVFGALGRLGARDSRFRCSLTPRYVARATAERTAERAPHSSAGVSSATVFLSTS